MARHRLDIQPSEIILVLRLDRDSKIKPDPGGGGFGIKQGAPGGEGREYET